MKKFLPKPLIALAEACPAPLYVVGGSVRDFLAGYPLAKDADWDLASPMSEDELIAAAEREGIHVRSVYRHTGTVKLTDGESGYEFTRFRSDKYVRGVHTPSEIAFTEDIGTDARRRDFCANAVYYDIRGDAFSDPLGGIGDIRKGILRTVREAERVFGEDGLRLMRLARLSAETGFSPDAEALSGARRNAALIRDIAPERVFAELRLLLLADRKRGDKEAPYRGLCVLKETGVLKEILPELAAGDGLDQREDYHVHDVLEHSLRCVRYSPSEIRFAALLHDVGKPYCFARDGNFYAHAEEGARIAEEILTRLKAPRALTQETALLVKMHMRDFDGKMREIKVRREIRALGDKLPLLLALKQADFSACKEVVSPAPTVVKWERVLSDMRREGVPFSVKELAIGGAKVQSFGVPAEETSAVLARLLDICLACGRLNNRETLEKAVLRYLRGRAD